MAFRVEISPRAFNNLDEIAEYIKQRGSFEQAQKWFNGIIAAIRTLEDLRHSCPVADESEELGQEVRLLLYGKRNRRYKVYYSVQQTTPSTGTVRHESDKQTTRQGEHSDCFLVADDTS